MPKTQSSHLVKRHLLTNSFVSCAICRDEFSVMGFHNHVGSWVCSANAVARPIRLEAERLTKVLSSYKSSVSKTFINACERRGMLEFIGAEEHVTKYLPPINGQPHQIQTEYWVDKWVGDLYRSYSMLRVIPNPAYYKLEELFALPPEDQESAISLLILKNIDL